MQTKFIVLLLAVFAVVHVQGQQKDEVLLTINEHPVYTSEFKRVYLKNIDLVKDESQKNVDEYLNLFINYKLKLEAAKSLGLDKKETYLKELEGYKKQLASSYLTDTKASDALVKEAYDHLQERVKARHILVMLKQGAAPADTLKAYQKIIEARNKVVNGADFATTAKAYSEDPSAQKNGGDLGWFSAFRMVYPFEKAAFQTAVGSVSMPFKTRFGYHIVQVDDREKQLGQVEVAHIMVAFSKTKSKEEAEAKIKEIQQQLLQKVSFESLAKQYSDDRNTAVNGGKINRFGQGALNSEAFEKVAFELTTPGELSTPVKTKYGWHIIKLIQKYPPKTFEESKSEITNRIKRDERSQLITTSFINSLKDKYQVQTNKDAISFFKTQLPEDIFTKGWEYDAKAPEYRKELMVIGKDTHTYADFAAYLKKAINPKVRRKSDIGQFVTRIYTAYESKKLLRYYEAHLEEDNQEFANIVAEYRDGLLLFDLMETKIWNASKNDSIGLQKFYDAHKKQYVKPQSYKVLKASSAKQDLIDKVKTIVATETKLGAIKQQVNASKEEKVLFSEEELVAGEDAITSKFSGVVGETITFEEDKYITLIKVNEVIPSRVKTFEETKGKVINDYQEDLEQQWLQQLRDTYHVKVEKKTLKKIKKQLAI